MKQKPDRAASHAWIKLHHAQRRMQESVENALKREGLPVLAWYDVLLELSRGQNNGMRQFEIGEKILLNKHNLSRLLDRLQKNGLVERQACAEDARGNRLTITTAGIALKNTMWPVYAEAIEQNFGSRLNSSDVAELDRILSKLLNPGEQA